MSDGLFARWQERGRDTPSGNSMLVTLSGLIAIAIALSQSFTGGSIRSDDTLDAGTRETIMLAQKRGARADLIERRAKEMRLFLPDAEGREDRLVRYAQSLVRARDLVRGTGESYPSDDLVSAVADAEAAGGVDDDLRWIIEKAEGDRRIVALSRYYILIRRGERSSTAAAIALRNEEQGEGSGG